MVIANNIGNKKIDSYSILCDCSYSFLSVGACKHYSEIEIKHH